MNGGWDGFVGALVVLLFLAAFTMNRMNAEIRDLRAKIQHYESVRGPKAMDEQGNTYECWVPATWTVVEP